MGLKDLIIGLVIFAVFVFAILNFAIQFGYDNGADINIADDSRISEFRANIEGNITGIEPEFNTSSGEFFKTPAAQGDTQEFFDPLSLRGISQIILFVPRVIYGLTLGLVLDLIFGGTSQANWRFVVIFSILLGLLGTVIILYIVRWIRSGEVD